MTNLGGFRETLITLDDPEAEASRPGDARAPESFVSRAEHARQLAEIEALHALIELPLRNLAFDPFAREFLMVFSRAVPSEAASLLEVNYEESHLFFRSALGHAAGSLGHFQIPMGSGIAGEVLRSGQPLNLGGDLPEDSRYLKSIQDSVGFEARSIVALPLVIRGRVFGVIELLNRVGGERYSQQDVELLMRLIKAASASMETRLVLGHLSVAEHARSSKAA